MIHTPKLCVYGHVELIPQQTFIAVGNELIAVHIDLRERRRRSDDTGSSIIELRFSDLDISLVVCKTCLITQRSPGSEIMFRLHRHHVDVCAEEVSVLESVIVVTS